MSDFWIHLDSLFHWNDIFQKLICSFWSSSVSLPQQFILNHPKMFSVFALTVFLTSTVSVSSFKLNTASVRFNHNFRSLLSNEYILNSYVFTPSFLQSNVMSKLQMSWKEFDNFDPTYPVLAKLVFYISNTYTTILMLIYFYAMKPNLTKGIV